MTNQELEKRLADEICLRTPDLLEELMGELDGCKKEEKASEELYITENPVFSSENETKGGPEIIQTEVIPALPPAKRPLFKRRVFTAAAGIAAAFLIMIGGITLYQRNQQPFAVVGLDVNPSVEITVNNKEKVLLAQAVNDDGSGILSSLSLEGKDIREACSDIVAAMQNEGYLGTRSNSVLLSVRSSDTDRGREMEKVLSDEMYGLLDHDGLSPSVLALLLDYDEKLAAFADANGISYGKAALIRSLLNSGASKMTEQDLLKLTTQELIYLGQERQVETEVSLGSVSEDEYIGREKAIEIALTDAKAARSEVLGLEVESDCDAGRIIYELEFTFAGVEYDYEIDAVTGEILYTGTEPGEAAAVMIEDHDSGDAEDVHDDHDDTDDVYDDHDDADDDDDDDHDDAYDADDDHGDDGDDHDDADEADDDHDDDDDDHDDAYGADDDHDDADDDHDDADDDHDDADDDHDDDDDDHDDADDAYDDHYDADDYDDDDHDDDHDDDD